MEEKFLFGFPNTSLRERKDNMLRKRIKKGEGGGTGLYHLIVSGLILQ